jgi:molybdenum cofactor cytidylyltransferase
MISAVVLAVGRSRGTGTPDPSTSTDGKPALQCILESAVASALDEIVCVTGNLETLARGYPLADKRILWLWNPASKRGASASVITGLWATHPKSEGVMFLGVDQPMIHKELINSLIARFHETLALIVASSINGEPASPILIRRKLFPEILHLSGDQDERALLAKYKKQTDLVEWKEDLSFSRPKEPKSMHRSRGLT